MIIHMAYDHVWRSNEHIKRYIENKCTKIFLFHIRISILLFIILPQVVIYIITKKYTSCILSLQKI